MSKIRLWALLMGTLLCAGAIKGQERFEEVLSRNLWNAGVNRAALRLDSLDYSYAEAWGGLQRGGLTDHSVAQESYTAGVETHSIRHLKRISYLGSLSYDYFDGKAMWGSMFTRPGYWPVDMYEYTPGRKIRERYAFTGGLSADLNSSWRIGLWADFAAGNYAKRKDLRHKNTTLDLEVAPSLMWHRGRWAVGATYRYEKHSERLKGEEVGSTPDSYGAFLDKGLFYGIEQLWSSSDLHLEDSGISAFPIQKQLHGAALQLQYAPLFVEGSYRHMAGQSGEKGSTWHRFEGQLLEGRLGWQHTGRKEILHTLQAKIGWQELSNREVILSTETQGGVTTSTAYGSRPIFGSRALDLGLEYELQHRRFHFEGELLYRQQNEQSSLQYPHLKGEELQQWSARAQGRWMPGHVELSWGLFGSVGTVEGYALQVSSTLPENPYPEQQLTLHDWHNDYLTAPRVGANLALRIGLVKGFYIDLAARYEHGFGLQFVPQPNRIECLLTLGCRW